MERPAEHAGKAVLTAEEAALYVQDLPFTNWDDRERWDRTKAFSFDSDVEHGYNRFWLDFGTGVNADRRTSLIVDPPDGRIPWVPGTAFLPDGRLAWVEGEQRPGGYGDAFLGLDAAGPEDRPLGERCILGMNSGPPKNPSAYNNNVQLLQTPGTVVIFNEMVHGRAHRAARRAPASACRAAAVDGRLARALGGRHPGGRDHQLSPRDELRRLELAPARRRAVHAHGSRRARLRVHGRGSAHVDAALDGAHSDAEGTAGPIFEYACHEGNYGLFNILTGARARERAGRRESPP